MSAAYPLVTPVQTGPSNADLPKAAATFRASNAWRDLSTVCISPTRGVIPTKIVMSWMAMMPTLNQRLKWLMSVWVEVGAAYEEMVRFVLDDPELSKYKYILTLEEDNAPPQDGLHRLYESIQDYDVVGGLYWTKCSPSTPMIYGDPADPESGFRPQTPIPDTVQPCNGLGMGFTLFKLDMFRQIERPWFQTVQEARDGSGTELMTQDLFFCKKATAAGFKLAVDCRVKVAHYSLAEDRYY
jgi:hypothetical protein